VAPVSSPAGKSGVPPRFFGSRTGTVLELATETAPLRCECQMAPAFGGVSGQHCVKNQCRVGFFTA
jgi:hypothetical protein